MIKKGLILLLLLISLLLNPASILADHLGGGAECDNNLRHCRADLSCAPSKAIPANTVCQPKGSGDVFGKITPPEALKDLIGADPSGTKGVSIFFSRLVSLMYALAGLVLILMLIWGAWDWLTSEGDKEKLHAAQRKLINAVIGIVIFAAAFAIIQVLEAFTGFSFYAN